MRERHQVTLSRTAQGRGLRPERWAQTGPRSARVASTVQARSGPGRVPRSPRTHRPSSTSQVSPLPCIYVGLILKSIGFELESDTGKLKKKLCSASIQIQSRAAQPGGTETHGKQFVSGSSFWLQAREGARSLGEKDCNGLRPGATPGAPGGQAWLPNLEMQRAALQQVEGSPHQVHQAGEKRGSHPLPTLFLASSRPRGALDLSPRQWGEEQS